MLKGGSMNTMYRPQRHVDKSRDLFPSAVVDVSVAQYKLFVMV